MALKYGDLASLGKIGRVGSLNGDHYLRGRLDRYDCFAQSHSFVKVLDIKIFKNCNFCSIPEPKARW